MCIIQDGGGPLALVRGIIMQSFWQGMVSVMTNMVIKAIEIMREKLHMAAKNAKYDFQAEEVKQINARLDRLVCRFMKTHKIKEH